MRNANLFSGFPVRHSRLSASALASPGMGETILVLSPRFLLLTTQHSYRMDPVPTGGPQGNRCNQRPDRRKACVSGDRRADPTSLRRPNADSARGELENVKSVFQRAIPTIPGKTLTAVVVSYPPGGKSPPHHHAKSAFIYAFVLSGAIRTGIGSERPVVYQAGDSFYEEPGAHHTVSENASETKPASLLAVFIRRRRRPSAYLARPRSECRKTVGIYTCQARTLSGCG